MRLALALALLPLPVLAQDPSGIIGSWRCVTASEAGSGAYTVTFSSDGRIGSEARLSFAQGDAAPIHVEFVYEGSWRPHPTPGTASFLETARSFTYTTLELGGDRIPWANLPPEFTGEMEGATDPLIGAETENRILTLTDGELSYLDTTTGTTATCTTTGG